MRAVGQTFDEIEHLADRLALGHGAHNGGAHDRAIGEEEVHTCRATASKRIYYRCRGVDSFQ